MNWWKPTKTNLIVSTLFVFSIFGALDFITYFIKMFSNIDYLMHIILIVSIIWALAVGPNMDKEEKNANTNKR